MTIAAPYSDDLRQKVIKALTQGMRKAKAARVFNISRNPIALWLKRKEKTGDIKAKNGYQKGSKHKIIDWDKFQKFAKEYGGLTQSMMAQAWGEEIS